MSRGFFSSMNRWTLYPFRAPFRGVFRVTSASLPRKYATPPSHPKRKSATWVYTPDSFGLRVRGLGGQGLGVKGLMVQVYENLRKGLGSIETGEPWALGFQNDPLPSAELPQPFRGPSAEIRSPKQLGKVMWCDSSGCRHVGRLYFVLRFKHADLPRPFRGHHAFRGPFRDLPRNLVHLFTPSADNNNVRCKVPMLERLKKTQLKWSGRRVPVVDLLLGN